MPTPEPNADSPQPVTPPAESAEESRANLADFLDKLVTPARVRVEDALGNVYDLPGALPARRQIVVLRKLEALKDLAGDRPEVQNAIALLRTVKATGGDGMQIMGAVGGALYQLAGDDAVLDILSQAFADAHPQAVAKAADASHAAGEGATTPADLFPVEELIAGLLPFFFRLLKRAGGALAATTA